MLWTRLSDFVWDWMFPIKLFVLTVLRSSQEYFSSKNLTHTRRVKTFLLGVLLD